MAGQGPWQGPWQGSKTGTHRTNRADMRRHTFGFWTGSTHTACPAEVEVRGRIAGASAAAQSLEIAWCQGGQGVTGWQLIRRGEPAKGKPLIQDRSGLSRGTVIASSILSDFGQKRRRAQLGTFWRPAQRSGGHTCFLGPDTTTSCISQKAEGAWGGGSRHLAMASRICGVRVHVTGDQECIFGDVGEQWHVRFDARLEQYDVVISANHEAPRTFGHEYRENTCAQAGKGQTEASNGDTPSMGDTPERSHHRRVERWGGSGYRTKGAPWGA